MKISDEDFKKVKDQFPRALRLTCGDAGDLQVVVRPPTPGEYKKFRAESVDDRRKPFAVENLVKGCIVLPDRGTFDDDLAERPALCEEFAEEVFKLAGLTQATRAEG